jgi:anaerobic magnesium-protoporphyrin IX monomethyl ester cyclase
MGANMSANIILLNPARHFIANEAGLGYLVPLGLTLLGGPLIDAGYSVKLIDHDLNHWSSDKLMREIANFQADYILLGHSGSTASHLVVVQTVRAIRRSFPNMRIIYGGVYPSYAYQSILQDVPEIDVIVRGEGERTVVELIANWERETHLESVPGIVWRRNEEVVVNRPQTILQDLDQYRPAWELLDFSSYRMFGFERVAGFQFSRGCPLTCSYCGQWLFWKKWRHRSPENMISQLKLLRDEYHVSMVWFADENFAADREVTQRLLEMIIEADLNLSLNINMTAADVVRDADLMPLYKRAGVDYVVMGVESLKDSVIAGIRKNNPFAISKEAVHLLRENKILSLTNIIYGLEEESWKTIFEKFKGMLELDSDILNAVYLMPHFWTMDGRKTDPSKIIQKDLSKWSYRNQVLAVEKMGPLALFAGVKLTEALFHLRPNSIRRFLFPGDKNYSKIYRQSIGSGIKVFLAEIREFIFEVRFSARGSTQNIPGKSNSSVESSPLVEITS